MTTLLEPATKATATRVVFDNAGYAFNNADAATVESALGSLPADFIYDYREALSGVAVGMLEPLLTAAWKRRGRKVVFVPASMIGSSEVERLVPDELYHEVWDEAVSNLPDGTVIASAAGLNDELNGYGEADRDRRDD